MSTYQVASEVCPDGPSGVAREFANKLDQLQTRPQKGLAFTLKRSPQILSAIGDLISPMGVGTTYLTL